MEYDVIYVDEDGRNARPLMQDGRRPMGAPGPGFTWYGGRQPTAGWRPPAGAVVVPPNTRPTVITGGAGARPYYPAPAPYYPAQQPTVVYHQPAAGVLGNLTMADLADLGLQVLAAIRPLPPAPTGQGDVETDVNNMVIYQTALAEFAQNDERLRTLGNVLARVLRK